MTAFATTDLPASVNTVEKLHAWSGMVLNHLNPDATAVEAPGSATRVATFGLFYITASDPPKWRGIIRASIPFNANWQRGAAKPWTFAEDISAAAIPAEFKS